MEKKLILKLKLILELNFIHGKLLGQVLQFLAIQFHTIQMQFHDRSPRSLAAEQAAALLEQIMFIRFQLQQKLVRPQKTSQLQWL
jgi:hypothetical protein